jgi:RimJ/RimL family protein N-acetyltransferase
MNEFDRFFGGGLELETPRVLLRKMKAEDLEHFKALSTDENTWKYFSKDLSHPSEMEAWINEAIQGYDQKTRVPYFLLR